MPTYEYICKACGHALEIFHSMSEAPKKKCPACGKAKLERQISSGAGIVFKGTGFYQTDYRSDSYKTAQKADSEGAKPAAESSGGAAAPSEAKSSDAKSSEAKPAAAKPSESKAKKPGSGGGRPARSDG